MSSNHTNNLEQYSDVLRSIQLLHAGTIRKLNDICKKYDIRYWAFDGTLLGTIRHKGFIPWDDDLDIAMMREDYEKLCRVPKEEWGDEYKLCTTDCDDEIHDKPFARIYLAKSRVQSEKDLEWRKWSDNSPWYTSLMCDIFIFDYTPDNETEYLKVYKKINKFRKLYKIVKLKPCTISSSSIKRMKAFLRRCESRIIRLIWKKPWVVIDKKMKSIAKKYGNSGFIGTYCSSGKLNLHVYKYDEVYPLVEMDFENTTVYVPRNWDYMLTEKYGDYMTPPPEAERHHLVPSFLDLGDGVEHVFSEPLPGSLGYNQYYD